MAKAILIFKDKAGNKLFRRKIKTRGTIQLSAKNKEGKLVTAAQANILIRRARRAGKKIL